METAHKQVITTGAIAVAASLFLVGLKTWAYIETDSAAVLTSLFDSASDLVISLLTFASLVYSVRPPDDDHRFGHGKMEGISALFQAMLMGIGAAILLSEGIRRLITPAPITAPEIGIGVMIVAAITAVFVVWVQTRAVRKHRSLALEADRGHYASDALINIFAIIVLVLVPMTGFIWLDPLFAVIVAAIMGRTAAQIARKAADMLLDREVEPDIKQEIARAILSDPAIKRMHDLRAIRHGMRLVVSYDIEMDGALSLAQAHDIAVASEDRILAIYPHAEIMTHMDPIGAAHSRRHHVMDPVTRDDIAGGNAPKDTHSRTSL